MATEIGLLSMTQIQKLSQSQQHHKNQPQPNPNTTTITTTTPSSSSSTWMWDPKQQQQQQHEEEDDSWEVRAFAEDTRNIMDTTWPPRSYTCNFCRREFRSAQALGGHMNVHRRDRARLHQPHPPSSVINPSHSHLTVPPFINIPPQELVANAGLCLLYHLPSPNSNTHHVPSFNAYAPTLNTNGESPPSTLLSISSSYPPNNFMMQTCSPPSSFNFPVAQVAAGFNSISSCSSKLEQPANSTSIEELDLELRLGQKPAT